jgi:hypothetical protein
VLAIVSLANAHGGFLFWYEEFISGFDILFKIWYCLYMKAALKKVEKKPDESLTLITSQEFLASFNKNMPEGFKHASLQLLEKYKHENPSLFKHGDLWSLDEHRKKVMDWFQLLKVN